MLPSQRSPGNLDDGYDVDGDSDSDSQGGASQRLICFICTTDEQGEIDTSSMLHLDIVDRENTTWPEVCTEYFTQIESSSEDSSTSPPPPPSSSSPNQPHETPSSLRVQFLNDTPTSDQYGSHLEVFGLHTTDDEKIFNSRTLGFDQTEMTFLLIERPKTGAAKGVYPRDSLEWACGTCTLLNPLRESRCTVCNQGNQPEVRTVLFKQAVVLSKVECERKAITLAMLQWIEDGGRRDKMPPTGYNDQVAMPPSGILKRSAAADHQDQDQHTNEGSRRHRQVHPKTPERQVQSTRHYVHGSRDSQRMTNTSPSERVQSRNEGNGRGSGGGSGESERATSRGQRTLLNASSSKGLGPVTPINLSPPPPSSFQSLLGAFPAQAPEGWVNRPPSQITFPEALTFPKPTFLHNTPPPPPTNLPFMKTPHFEHSGGLSSQDIAAFAFGNEVHSFDAFFEENGGGYGNENDDSGASATVGTTGEAAELPPTRPSSPSEESKSNVPTAPQAPLAPLASAAIPLAAAPAGVPEAAAANAPRDSQAETLMGMSAKSYKTCLHVLVQCNNDMMQAANKMFEPTFVDPFPETGESDTEETTKVGEGGSSGVETKDVDVVLEQIQHVRVTLPTIQLTDTCNALSALVQRLRPKEEEEKGEAGAKVGGEGKGTEGKERKDGNERGDKDIEMKEENKEEKKKEDDDGGASDKLPPRQPRPLPLLPPSSASPSAALATSPTSLPLPTFELEYKFIRDCVGRIAKDVVSKNYISHNEAMKAKAILSWCIKLCVILADDEADATCLDTLSLLFVNEKHKLYVGGNGVWNNVTHKNEQRYHLVKGRESLFDQFIKQDNGMQVFLDLACAGEGSLEILEGRLKETKEETKETKETKEKQEGGERKEQTEEFAGIAAPLVVRVAGVVDIVDTVDTAVLDAEETTTKDQSERNALVNRLQLLAHTMNVKEDPRAVEFGIQHVLKSKFGIKYISNLLQWAAGKETSTEAIHLGSKKADKALSKKLKTSLQSFLDEYYTQVAVANIQNRYMDRKPKWMGTERAGRVLRLFGLAAKQNRITQDVCDVAASRFMKRIRSLSDGEL